MIYLYNELTQKKQAFVPLHKRWVGLYTCGPTVYNFAHLGNLRTYIFEDILRRTLAYRGMRVRHVMNITDIDDKIIRDAKKARKTIFEFVKPYETAFFEDLDKLHILRAWKYPKATEHIPSMVRLIAILLKKGLAYQMDDAVYFSITKFPSYGKLSRIPSHDLHTGVRVSADEYTKKDAQDFALWKDAKKNEPSWQAPFGKGRPGWHIECSAMSMKYLGRTFDIHAGGVDLIFPHHENEIAQSEGATGTSFAHFFVEGEHLQINGEKMSKSLGNVFTLRDIETKKIDPLAYRYLALAAHYRSRLNFTWESLAASEQSLMRLQEFNNAVARLAIKKEIRKNPRARMISLLACQKRFDAAINNDLQTPQAIALLWDLIHKFHKNPAQFDAKKLLTFLGNVDRILGLGLAKTRRRELIPKEIEKMAQEREALRQKKEWTRADTLREDLEKRGWRIKDMPEGFQLKKL